MYFSYAVLLDTLPLILAPIVGSFIGVVVDRWPNGRSLGGRSRCGSCHQTLGVVDLIPILSYLALRGRCRHCKQPIPRNLFYTETLLVALVIPLLFMPEMADRFIGFGLIAVLYTLALLDRRHFWLPDTLTLYLIAVGLLLNTVKGGDAVLQAAIGAALGFGLIAGIRAFYQWRRGIEAIGLGDAKLLAGAGAWLGWTALPLLLLIASLSGLMISMVDGKGATKDRRIPFGIYLATGFYIIWCASNIPAANQWLAVYARVL